MAERTFTRRITVEGAEAQRRLQAYNEAIERATYVRLKIRVMDILRDMKELGEFVSANVERLEALGYTAEDIQKWLQEHPFKNENDDAGNSLSTQG